MADDFAGRHWESTAKRHYAEAVTHLRRAHDQIGYALRDLDKVDPKNLTASRGMPTEFRNVIADLVEAANRLAILDELRDFEPVFKPAADETPKEK